MASENSINYKECIIIYCIYQVSLINKFPGFDKLCYNYHTFKTLPLKSQ